MKKLTISDLLNLLIKPETKQISRMSRVRYYLQRQPLEHLEKLLHNFKLMGEEGQAGIIGEAHGCVQGEIDVRKEKQRKKDEKSKVKGETQ